MPKISIIDTAYVITTEVLDMNGVFDQVNLNSRTIPVASSFRICYNLIDPLNVCGNNSLVLHNK